MALHRHLAPYDEAGRLPIFPLVLDGASPETLPPFLSLFRTEKWSGAEPVPATLLAAVGKRASPLHHREPFEGCPFLGLNAFRQKDAQLFFGRRQETLDALACLGSQQDSNPEQTIATSALPNSMPACRAGSLTCAMPTAGACAAAC